MTKEALTYTKAIATRVPMKDYVTFLNEAVKRGLSMSEWLTLKVYSSGAEDELKKQIEELKKKNTQMVKDWNGLVDCLAGTDAIEKIEVKNYINKIAYGNYKT